MSIRFNLATKVQEVWTPSSPLSFLGDADGSEIHGPWDVARPQLKDTTT